VAGPVGSRGSVTATMVGIRRGLADYAHIRQRAAADIIMSTAPIVATDEELVAYVVMRCSIARGQDCATGGSSHDAARGRT